MLLSKALYHFPPAGRLALAGWLALQAMAPSHTTAQQRPLSDRVEIRRTTYGVPHILAEDLEALGFGLAWVQLEDYGDRLAINLIRARGQMGLVFGRDSMESDFIRRQTHQQIRAHWPEMSPQVRTLYEGFAQGVNRYVATHRSEFHARQPADFSGLDVAALWVETSPWSQARSFARRLQAEERARSDSLARLGAGSNAWAFAPARTVTGHAILLRNPHLNWDAGYYEAHVTVPDTINFYGDFRVGFPFLNNGGFNDRLGFATTNNDVDPDEVYVFDAHPTRPDHFLMDGQAVPLTSKQVTVEYRHNGAIARTTREYWYSPFGPVVERTRGKVWLIKSAVWDEWRKGDQWLRMIQARNLAEWQDAMRLRAQSASNFTYADADGNIYYVWNGSVPALPHPPGGDTLAIPAAGAADLWQELIPFEALPQVLNPPRGYVQNANDPPHFASLGAVLDSAAYPPNVSPPLQRFRSQLSHLLATEQERVSLDDVVRLKHSTRMFGAERLTDDLVAAIRAAVAAGDTSSALSAAADLLAGWDRTASPEARGAVLFTTWFSRYLAGEDSATARRPWAERYRAAFREPWDPARPIATPRGLSDPAKAVRALSWAMAETTRLHGGWDVAWGEVNRIRHGGLDLPANGCSGEYGCFRVLWSEPDSSDGKMRIRGGDGWSIAVEFSDPPVARSIMAYGQSSRPDSPHHTDQLELFARGEFKPVAFTEEDIARTTIRRYRPGAP